METKHTKGEWFIDESVIFYKSIQSKVSEHTICEIVKGINRNREEALANAKLIVAAPDLLEAAILLSDGISQGDKQKLHNGNIKIKEAIKKVTE